MENQAERHCPVEHARVKEAEYVAGPLRSD